jgi:hypothetical protein
MLSFASVWCHLGLLLPCLRFMSLGFITWSSFPMFSFHVPQQEAQLVTLFNYFEHILTTLLGPRARLRFHGRACLGKAASTNPRQLADFPSSSTWLR